MKKLIFSCLFLITFSITAQELPKLKKNVSVKQKDVNASEFTHQNTIKILDKKIALLRNNNTTKPIVIVDGKVINQNKIHNINPKSIASINVFKGKKAIKQFGEKGKNGVIIINLK